MYMNRKRFLYWQVSPVTRVYLDRTDAKGAYCFFPARLVRQSKQAIKFLPVRILSMKEKALFSRSVISHG